MVKLWRLFSLQGHSVSCMAAASWEGRREIKSNSVPSLSNILHKLICMWESRSVSQNPSPSGYTPPISWTEQDRDTMWYKIHHKGLLMVFRSNNTQSFSCVVVSCFYCYRVLTDWKSKPTLNLKKEWKRATSEERSVTVRRVLSTKNMNWMCHTLVALAQAPAINRFLHNFLRSLMVVVIQNSFKYVNYAGQIHYLTKSNARGTMNNNKTYPRKISEQTQLKNNLHQ